MVLFKDRHGSGLSSLSLAPVRMAVMGGYHGCIEWVGTRVTCYSHVVDGGREGGREGGGGNVDG